MDYQWELIEKNKLVLKGTGYWIGWSDEDHGFVAHAFDRKLTRSDLSHLGTPYVGSFDSVVTFPSLKSAKTAVENGMEITTQRHADLKELGIF